MITEEKHTFRCFSGTRGADLGRVRWNWGRVRMAAKARARFQEDDLVALLRRAAERMGREETSPAPFRQSGTDLKMTSGRWGWEFIESKNTY